MPIVDTATAMVLAQLRFGSKTDKELRRACIKYGLFIRMPLLREILIEQLKVGGIVASGAARAFGSIGQHKTKAKRPRDNKRYTITRAGNLTLDGWMSGIRLSA